ncbi:MAG: hypothetical protein R2874_11680 [Desulfobacterales bacterium]|jgi:hypothetical protein
MKGAFFIVILIALVIVGLLVMKDMDTETADGVKRREAVEKAEDAAAEAEKAMERVKDAAKNVEIPAIE